MNVLVTGGAGYIGSTLVPMLLSQGDSVTVVDTFRYGQTPFLDWCHHPKLKIVRGDARNRDLMKDLIKSADLILPLACITGAPACDMDPTAAKTINYQAVVDCLELKSKAQMLIYPCTNSGYGIGEKGLECNEDSPLKPISLYGKVKVEAEKALLDSGEAVTFRFATVFGSSPRMRLDLLVNDFVYRARFDRFIVLFEGHFKRNYLHIRDAAHSFMHATQNYTKMKGQPYNVGLSDANLSKIELCETIKKHLPDFVFLSSEIAKDKDQRNYIVSNARIEATGFKPKFSLEDGIRELLNTFEIVQRNQFTNL